MEPPMTRRQAFVLVSAGLSVALVLCLSGNVESHAEVAVDAIKKNAKAPPAPAPAPQCLQWLAGNCMEWNGAPPGPPAPAPGPSGSSNSGSQSKSSYGGGGSSGSEGGSSSGGGYIPTPAHKVETGKAETHKYDRRAPCNSSSCCEYFFPGNKLVGLGSMFDPRCVIDFPPHVNCVPGFMCSYCCKLPLNGACPMKDRMCNSLNKKKIAAIFEEQREEEAKKAEEEKKIKEKKLAKQRKEAAKKKEEQEKVDEEKAKARKKAVARAKAKGETPPPTDAPTPRPTRYPTAEPTPRHTKFYTPPCKNNACCQSYWPGSVYDTGCTPGKIGHEGCVGGFACAYHKHRRNEGGNAEVWSPMPEHMEPPHMPEVVPFRPIAPAPETWPTEPTRSTTAEPTHPKPEPATSTGKAKSKDHKLAKNAENAKIVKTDHKKDARTVKNDDEGKVVPARSNWTSPDHSGPFQNPPEHASLHRVESIPRNGQEPSKTHQAVPKHTKTHQAAPKHAKTHQAVPEPEHARFHRTDVHKYEPDNVKPQRSAKEHAGLHRTDDYVPKAEPDNSKQHTVKDRSGERSVRLPRDIATAPLVHEDTDAERQRKKLKELEEEEEKLFKELGTVPAAPTVPYKTQSQSPYIRYNYRTS
ncbi:hypothetical protein AAMO2058_000399300 [Amorphochlora amoebiformis]